MGGQLGLSPVAVSPGMRKLILYTQDIGRTKTTLRLVGVNLVAALSFAVQAFHGEITPVNYRLAALTKKS